MGIDRSNYEAYYLDYLEENLDQKIVRELEIFLQLNPDLKEELDEVKLIALEEEKEVSSELKWQLKREEKTGLSYSDYLIISSVENVQNDVEKKQFSKLLSAQPKLLEELKYYEATKQHGSSEIVFPHKEKLIKKESKLIYWNWIKPLAAAAAIFLFVFFNSHLFTSSQYEPQRLVTEGGIQNIKNSSENILSETSINKKIVVQKKEVLKNSPVLETEIEREQLAIVESTKLRSESEKVQKTDTPFPIEEKEEWLKDKVGIEDVAEKNDMDDDQANEAAEEESSNINEFENNNLENGLIATNVESKETLENEPAPLKDFAKDRLKKKVLKNKSLKEFIVDEFVELTDNKVSVKTEKGEDGTNKLLAINIGNFSFSRKK